MKGSGFRQRRQAQGVDDTVTYSVLAAEGFLPGYGLDVGSVKGMAEVHGVRGARDFDLPRVPSVALREYVPGNLIYANNLKFVPRRFVRNVEEGRTDLLLFEVNMEREAVSPAPPGAVADPGAAIIQSMPVGDVTLIQQSRISDEEDNRFQLGVAIFGRELGQHNGGQAWKWGDRDVQLRNGVRLQLANVGAPMVINRRQGEFGYPVCTVCGQSVSPFSSQTQRDDFAEKHGEWCGRRPESIGFHADLSVDAFSIIGCQDREEAYSVLEGIRSAAADILDMALEDLQILVIGQSAADEVNGLLYDPMPGGSGLLEQICARFPEIIAEAKRVAASCPSLCEASCIDCYQRYRNAFYHKHLDRHVIVERLEEWGDTLMPDHPIPPRAPEGQPAGGEGQPVNVAETRLKGMLERAGFPGGRWQEQVILDRTLGSTTPDVTFDDPDDPDRKVFIYLDGLSGHLHGNPETRATDLMIRQELMAQDNDVLVITAHDLHDQQAMTRHFRRLARMLEGRERMRRVAEEAEAWFPD
jgi:hypothetical protein